MLKITDYAEKLLEGLDEVDFIDRVKTQQRNWIGRSYGTQVKFSTNIGDTFEVLHHPRRYAFRRYLYGNVARAPAYK